MSHHDTILDLLASARMMKKFLQVQKGFDRVSSSHFEVHEDELVYWAHLNDEFQDSLSYGEKHYNGMESFRSESFNTDEIWDKLQLIPSRRQRELHVLMRRAGDITEMREKIQDEQVRAFCEEISSVRNECANLITHERSLADDEIPF